MKTRTGALFFVLGAAVCGCSGETEPAVAAGGDADAGSSAAADLVDRALIESCAGFDVDKAASLLGVGAAELEVMETYSDRVGGQICRYWSAESNVGPGIDILLNDHESIAAARRIIETQRELVPLVDEVPPTGPARVEFDFGDDAFWDTNTSGVVVRVRNVVAQVQVSASRELTSPRDPAQIALERRVAEEVAAALGR